MKKSIKPNWQPEHFPVGTVVKLDGYYHNKETGETAFSKRNDQFEPMCVTVKSIFKNGIDSYCINADTSITFMTNFNFDHVERIVKRGEGKVVWEKIKHEEYFNKKHSFNQPSTKSHYYWNDTRFLMSHIATLIPNSQDKMLRETFIKDIESQSFVKKETLFGSYKVMHADKKKLRNYVRKNFNRWLMSAAEIRKAADEYNDEMEDLMNDDRLEDMGREQVVSGINEEGNNQYYLSGEPICGSCKVSYTNHGKQHPIGDGTDCPTCRAIDNEASYQMHEDYWS